jgi:hypothetical protein
MSRDPAPTAYVYELDTPGYRYSPASWNCRQNGRPTAANLAKHVAGFEASTRPGGCNSHLGATVVTGARIRRNEYRGEVVARYEPAPQPLFAVVA